MFKIQKYTIIIYEIERFLILIQKSLNADTSMYVFMYEIEISLILIQISVSVFQQRYMYFKYRFPYVYPNTDIFNSNTDICI